MSSSDLLAFTRNGWPRCCGEVMTFFVEARPPGPDDTPLEQPALPPD